MKKLMYMRAELGFPFSINSGYRCSDYNDSLYKSDLTHLHGPHTIGAADIRASFERSYQIIKLATSMDMGVGPTQHGKVDDRFIHVDNMGTRFWTY